MKLRRRLRWPLLSSAAVFLGAATWAAAVPIRFDSREEVFEIPKGTWKRRMAGEKIEILPQQIRLVAGARDVLVLRNRDDVPQTFGPALMMPGQSFRLPFERPAEYQFACTAHASGQMTVIVREPLSSPWARLRWRAGKLLKKVTWLQQEG